MPVASRRAGLVLAPALIPALAVLAAALLAVGCERRDGVAAGARSGGAAERGAAAGGGEPAGPVRIGFYADLSGQTSGFGQSTLRGVQLAVEEINAAGGILGAPVELLVEDDQGRPEQAATVVTKLIEQDEVVALVGENASTNTLAAAPIAQRARVPMISPSATNPRVTEVGDHIFRVCFIDPFQGEVMARFAASS